MSGKRGKTISEAAFKRLWLDNSITTEAIGDMLGITRANVSARARRRGLPTRNGPNIGARPRKIDCPEFAAMWSAPVEAAEIAKHYGVTIGTVYNTAKRHNLPKRIAHRWIVVSLAEYTARKDGRWPARRAA
jgi:hypothetical protein